MSRMSRKTAFAALKRASSIVVKSSYHDYFTASVGKTIDDDGWYVSVSFLANKEDGKKEHNNIFLYSTSTKEAVAQFYSDLEAYVSKF